ncbi:MAG: TatD family hydrolase [Desulfuromonas sp.]|nr:TatD family hydrolase [Desulfuromonas sp.]
MRLFDSHIHLHHLAPQDQLDSQVNWALIPAIKPDEWEPLLRDYAHRVGHYIALGVHPAYTQQWSLQAAARLSQLVQHPSVVAIGEVGLDANCAGSGANQRQQQVLCQQIKIAVEADKALILHCYKRYGALLEILRQEQAQQVGGIIHGYSGSLEVALQLWQLGFAIGIGRTILNPRAQRLRTTLMALPDAAYVIESDAPWPQHTVAYHGASNQGAGALPSIVAQIAQLRGQSQEQIANICAANCIRILNIEST